MASCTFTNLTPQQALALARWFKGQGEQDCSVWFDENDIEPPMVDVKNINSISVDEDQNVTVLCK